MKIFWQNDGEANADGLFIAELQDDNGNQKSMFKGTSHKEVADKVLASYASSVAEFDRMKAQRKPDRAPVAAAIAAPKVLTADESFRLGAQLSDPTTATKAVDELITARVGASPVEISRVLSDVQSREAEKYYAAEAQAFARDNPSYFPDDAGANRAKLFSALQLKGLDLTRNNLQIVYDELESQGLMLKRPEQFEQQQEQPDRQPAGKSAGEPNPPQTRPRLAAYSTGIRSTDPVAPRPPSNPKPKVTRAELEAMPKEEYLTKMRDPAFREAVDSLPRKRA